MGAGEASDGLLADRFGRFNLVFEIPLKAEGQTGHQDRSANEQGRDNAKHGAPMGFAGRRQGIGFWIEFRIPFLDGHEAINNRIQGAASNGEAQQGESTAN